MLDLMLPEIDGYEVLRQLRASAPTPVIMLTARGEEMDRIVGLELGADDYITKPFSPREVVARVRAVLRRTSEVPSTDGMLEFDDIRIDQGRRDVTVRGELVATTRKEFDLLSFLASSPGRPQPTAVARASMGLRVGRRLFHGDRAYPTPPREGRVDPSAPRRIITVWGVGYRFEP